jgi:type VI secretion system protein ImpL
MMRFLKSRWTLTFIGAAALCLLVWFLGPLLDALSGLVVRLAVIAAILLVWALTNFFLDRRRRQADRALTEGVTGLQPGEAQRADEVAALREKLTTALSLLRRASGTRGYLYEQPWYVIIGPPGAGKTTALLNAGLKFPLAAEMGQGAVAGVGGTRLCDWWFTEQAVMIDTAGRYTTQDSDAEVDRAGWEGFLDLLRRTRPRQPLNGVLVAIAAPDLAQASPAERLNHARAIRKRVRELTDKLGLRLPVYVLLTKVDLLTGFTEFFDDLDTEKRGQVWGETFDFKKDYGPAGPVSQFASVMAGLLKRLDDRLIPRLQAERGADRRVAIAGFPAQFATLESPISEFLTEAFGGSRLDPAPLLRGVYFTSGTQEGTPIDRLTGVLSRAFGVDQRRAPSLRPEKGRSYFLPGVLRVVFGEALLSGGGTAARNRSVVRIAAFAGLGLVTAGLAAALLLIRAGQMSEIGRVQAALDPYVQTASAQKLDPVRDGDLAPIAPLLDQARALPDAAAPGSFALGLGQSGKLGQASGALYHHALERVLLPRLLLRLEGQMRDHLNDPNYLYQATRVYLMLGGAGPLDRDLVQAWETQVDWPAAYPDPSLRASLGRHLQALLAAPLPPVSLDGGLVADAQSTFSRVPLADRVYSRLKFSAEAQGIPAWTPAEQVGATGVASFVRRSGKPLTDGIPGFFTVDGFHRVLLPRVLEVARQVAGESWVLGRRSEVDPNSPALLGLKQAVIQRYEADYERTWDALLADLTVAPLGSGAQASQALYVLASPQSPLKDLMTGIAKQLTLSKPPADLAAENGALAAGAKAAGGALAGLVKSATPTLPPGHEVDEHYMALRQYVGTGPGAPIDLTLKTLSDMQAQVAAATGGGGGGAAPAVAGGGNAAEMLKAQAATAPPVVARMMTGLAGGATAVRGGTAHQAAAAAYNGPDGPAMLCQAAVTGRYPFRPGAAAEIPLDDFGRLFAPGGMFDTYFTAQLRPFVDTSGRTWRPVSVDGVAPPISAADLLQFQRAAAIRQLFFAAGGAKPSVTFSITPESLDSAAKQVTLSLGSVTVTNSHGPVQPVEVAWPGTGMGTARLRFDPPSGGTGVIETEGPWALFRLFGRGQLVQGAMAELYTVDFTAGAHHARFGIRAGSVLNPLSPSVLQSFSCPHIQ